MQPRSSAKRGPKIQEWEKTIKDTLIVVGFAVAVAVFLSMLDYVFRFILDTILV